MFDPYGASGTVDERGISVRRFRAGRHFGGHAGTAPQRGPLSAAGRDLASGVPGSRCGDPFGRGTVPRVISLSW